MVSVLWIAAVAVIMGGVLLFPAMALTVGWEWACRCWPGRKRRELLASGPLAAIWAVLLAVAMGWYYLWPNASREFASPDGTRRLKVTVYSGAEIETYRVSIVLRDARSGKVLGRHHHRQRDIFFDSTEAGKLDPGFVQTWWRRDGSSVAVYICNAGYAVLMPQGTFLDQNLQEELGSDYIEFPPYRPDAR